MEWEAMRKDLQRVKKINEEFADKYEEEFVKFLRKSQVTAEESLQQELLFELLDHTRGICHVADYLEKKVVKEGVLSRGEDGNLLFDGEKMPMMKEMEVYVFEENCGQEVWTRTYVCGKEKPYLAGMDKEIDIEGMRARIRE